MKGGKSRQAGAPAWRHRGRLQSAAIASMQVGDLLYAAEGLAEPQQASVQQGEMAGRTNGQDGAHILSSASTAQRCQQGVQRKSSMYLRVLSGLCVLSEPSNRESRRTAAGRRASPADIPEICSPSARAVWSALDCRAAYTDDLLLHGSSKGLPGRGDGVPGSTEASGGTRPRTTT